jgi:hypothetical protein
MLLPIAVSNYAQEKLPPNVKSIFDSVKSVYGLECSIGVNSGLIKCLESYRNCRIIKNYLQQYDSIKNTIDKFRLRNHANLNSSAIILNMKAVFKGSVKRNIVNACGIYYGSNSVNNLILSYTIVHNFIISYFINVIQLSDFDEVLKKGFIMDGRDWYYSEKLKGLKGAFGSNN